MISRYAMLYNSHGSYSAHDRDVAIYTRQPVDQLSAPVPGSPDFRLCSSVLARPLFEKGPITAERLGRGHEQKSTLSDIAVQSLYVWMIELRTQAYNTRRNNTTPQLHIYIKHRSPKRLRTAP